MGCNKIIYEYIYIYNNNCTKLHCMALQISNMHPSTPFDL